MDRVMRLTTTRYEALATGLKIDQPELLDESLAKAGYVRLDLGAKPGPLVVIMPVKNGPLSRDPGHRAVASATMRALLFVAHAEGKPARERIATCLASTRALAQTDVVGHDIIEALAAYHVQTPPDLVTLPAEILGNKNAAAKAVYQVARDRGVVTDIAIERAYAVGGNVRGWREAIRRQLDPAEPVRRARRHDAAEYDEHGLGRPAGELLAWLRSNPEATLEQFKRRASLVGLDPKTAAEDIQRALVSQTKTPIGGPSSTSTSSLSGSSGPAGSSSSSSDAASNDVGGED